MESSVSRTDHGAQFSRSEISPSTAVVETTAAFLDRDPLDLDPLETCIDPDALDGIFEGWERTGDHRPGDVSFEYHGIEVVVTFSGDGDFGIEHDGSGASTSAIE